ncbi:MAG: protein translocase subunit SecF [Fibrobacteres bacterium]|nr:protein translocase subunit SecF [Fibrobacterota bacterium]
MKFISNANIQWMAKRKLFFGFSIVLVVISIGIILGKGINYSIDFKGGSFIHVKFTENIPLEDVRAAFSGNEELGDLEIKNVGESSSNEVMIGVKKHENMGSGLTTISTILESKFPGKYEVMREEAVGPKIGSELKTQALWATILSLLAIILYIAFRFEFKFGVAAVIPLFHDVIITLGVFTALGLEFSLPVVASFLTLIGYSINDTIIVFDRIRENLKANFKSSVVDIIDVSINSTLNRTIATSLATMIAVLCIFIIKTSVIRDFAFVMAFGIVVGTYSSIGIASAIIASWNPESLRKTKKA